MAIKTDFESIVQIMTAAKNGATNDRKPMVILRNPRAYCSALKVVPFNDRELISIKALIAWAAMENRMQENTVEAWLAAWADVDSIDDISRDRYDEVVRFLVDFNARVN